ncbi:MAG: hypothetical protein JSS66_06845 [Armatimonadetes bacterium]|nr:hypothetical protein [Armatimonadota bacterium]
MANKRIYVLGGGTFSHVRSHLALSTPAFGSTARQIAALCREADQTMDVELRLTKMADHTSNIVTNDDLALLCDEIKSDPLAKIVFFTAAVVDFNGCAGETPVRAQAGSFEQGKHAPRLDSRKEQAAFLRPADKVIDQLRAGDKGRKDLFLVGFKTTSGASPQEQYEAGLALLKRSSCNLVLANDTLTRNNMVICPEEAVYHETTNREAALRGLVEMVLLRSHLTFTRSTVVSGDLVPWESDLVPDTLRTIVDYCIERGAYKKFLGVTAGHFAVKLSDTEFLTSRRKTDFNDMKTVGLVRVKTDGPDTVLAYGSKPSVGGQSQRIVFHDHPGTDCIVHFHCPIKPGSKVPVASQREYECGSHQCGKNTSDHLGEFGNLKAVYLDQHGPNIVFSSTIDPQEVIDFIEENFDLEKKTGGYQLRKTSGKSTLALSLP